MHPVAIYHLRYNQTQNDKSPTFTGDGGREGAWKTERDGPDGKRLGRRSERMGMSSDLGYKDTDWLDRARFGLIAVLGPVPSRSHTARSA